MFSMQAGNFPTIILLRYASSSAAIQVVLFIYLVFTKNVCILYHFFQKRILITVQITPNKLFVRRK